MFKNLAGQSVAVYAFTATDDPVTGAAANITAQISLDGGAFSATTQENPSEIGNGVYEFDLTQAETNGNEFTISPQGTGATRMRPEFRDTVSALSGYLGGAVWVDTINGSAGASVLAGNGTAENPVDNWADALTIAGLINKHRFHISNGSSFALTGNSDHFTFDGVNWDLQLGSQSINGLAAKGANVTGIATATLPHPTFRGCHFGTVTLPPSVMVSCGYGDASGAFVAASAGEFEIIDGFSMVPGMSAPSFTFSGLGGVTNISNRGWRGGCTYVLDSDCTLSHEVLAGGNQVITTGGADVEVRGIFRSLTLNTSGTGTSQAVGTMGPVVINGTGGTVNLFGVSSSLDDNSSGTSVSDLTVSTTKVNSILEDTGTTIPASLVTIDDNVDSILVDTGTTIPDGIETAKDEILDRGNDAWVTGGSGTGSVSWDYTLTSSVSPNPPIEDALIEVFTDEEMTNKVRSNFTNTFGVANFNLDAGTYYIVRSKSGWTFENPDTEVVS